MAFLEKNDKAKERNLKWYPSRKRFLEDMVETTKWSPDRQPRDA